MTADLCRERRTHGDRGLDRSATTGSIRAPTPASTTTTTSTPSASWSWSRHRPRARRQERHAASTTTPASGCASSARFPVRKFERRQAAARPRRQPGHQLPREDPGRLAFTFQTLDKHGMVLNMAQTWHQVRPGEIRNDCGGCHAHSQKPTRFEDTAAAKPDYAVFDLTATDAAADDQGKRPVRQAAGTSRTRPACASTKGVKNVEYHRDIKPILDAELRRLPHAEMRRSRPATSCSTTTHRRGHQPGDPRLQASACPAPTTAWRSTKRASSATSRCSDTAGATSSASRYVRSSSRGAAC